MIERATTVGGFWGTLRELAHTKRREQLAQIVVREHGACLIALSTCPVLVRGTVSLPILVEMRVVLVGLNVGLQLLL